MLGTAISLCQAEELRWNDEALQGDLAPPSPFIVERVHRDLRFRNPVELLPIPGSSRMVLCEVNGKIFTFESDRQDAPAELVIDLKRTLDGFGQIYGFAFHPNYAVNGLVYLCYIHGNKDPEGSQVVEYQVASRDPFRLDMNSGRVLVTWLSGGHNGGCLHFGPDDGYLYVSTGDGEGPNPPDKLRAGQDCSNLLSSILRIDVDRRDPGLAYAIPPDNPFTDTDLGMPEIWAYGFRNPWKMAFDRKTGELWVADVGWDMWEMVFNVKRGGNYGWSVMEGRQPINVTWKRGPTPILPPIAEHGHVESRSITGGYVYRGSQFPELQGAYIYADYVTGKVWALHQEKGERKRVDEIASSRLAVICFGRDHEGELYIVDYAGGLYRFARNREEPSTLTSGFPSKLSETGLFADTASLDPAPGLLPYHIARERWADGLRGERWFALPHGGRIGPGRYPDGTVLVKTMKDPQSSHRVETQILQNHNGMWRAFSYAWDADQQDATLVPELGKTGNVPGRHPWRFHGRTECLTCHNAQAGTVLGWDNFQLGQDQLTELRSRGLSGESRDNRWRRRRSARPPAESHPARDYLHVNCSMCHRKNGGGLVPMELGRHLPNERLLALDVLPQRGDFGIADAKVIVPGIPERSTLYYRLAKSGSGHMPHLGSASVDSKGLKLIHDWIVSLKPDVQERPEPGFSDVPSALRLLDEVYQGRLNASEREQAIAEGLAASDPFIRDLFTAFEPSSPVFEIVEASDVKALLAIPGNRDAGRRLLTGAKGAICLTCHQLGTKGRNFGPSFERMGRLRNKLQLLEGIVQPSKHIETRYAAYNVETNTQTHTGFVTHHDAETLDLQTADLSIVTIRVFNIKQMSVQETSLMPAGLAQAFSAQELADLVTYIESLD